MLLLSRKIIENVRKKQVYGIPAASLLGAKTDVGRQGIDYLGFTFQIAASFNGFGSWWEKNDGMGMEIYPNKLHGLSSYSLRMKAKYD